MNELTVFNKNKLTMTSRQIADLLGSRHDSVRRTIERLIEKQVIQSTPLVDFKNAQNVTGTEYIVETKSTKGLREVAKVLGLKEREFIAWLEEKKILFRQSGQLLPFAQYQHDGYFEVKTGEANGHAFHQTRFTPKGINWITKRLGLIE